MHKMHKKGTTVTQLFVVVLLFWSVLLILMTFIGGSLYNEDYISASSQGGGFTGGLSLLAKVMFWNTAGLGVPWWVSAFLNVFSILSIYVMLQMVNALGNS